MEYKGKVYAKIAGKYIDCTQTVEELEAEIKKYKTKYEKCIKVIKKFDAGIIGMYDL